MEHQALSDWYWLCIALQVWSRCDTQVYETNMHGKHQYNGHHICGGDVLQGGSAVAELFQHRSFVWQQLDSSYVSKLGAGS